MSNIGYSVMSLDSSPAYEEITRVVIYTGENNYVEAGDETGATLECSSPFATEQIAKELLNRIAYFQYQPFSASCAFIDPASEVGDEISVGNVSSAIFNTTNTFGGLFSADIEAPTTREISHEYPFKTREDRRYERRMAEVGSRISQNEDDIEKETTEREAGFNELSELITQIAGEIHNDVDERFAEIKDYVVETGSNESWSFRKWESGDCELWGTKTVNAGSVTKTTYGQSAVYTEQISSTLPFSVTNAIVTGTAQNLWIVANAAVSGSTLNFVLTRMETNGDQTLVRFSIHGKWK